MQDLDLMTSQDWGGHLSCMTCVHLLLSKLSVLLCFMNPMGCPVALPCHHALSAFICCMLMVLVHRVRHQQVDWCLFSAEEAPS